MPFIKAIPFSDATDPLRSIYEQIISSRGKLAEVHKIQSLHPETIVSHMQLYHDIMFGKSPLKRYQREMIAVVVSAANNCPYCIAHHKEGLMHYWKDEEKADRLITDPVTAGLSEADLSLCTYARQLTLDPGAACEEQVITLRKHGFSDREILDTSLVTGYFNFVNRIVLGLGVEFSDEEVKGYKY